MSAFDAISQIPRVCGGAALRDSSISNYGSLILTQSISIKMGSTLNEETDIPT
jgi:hypothetical protein